MKMINIKTMVKTNSKKSQSIIGKVYTGFIEVTENGRYLWAKFSPSTRLTMEDALLDAEMLKADALQGTLV